MPPGLFAHEPLQAEFFALNQTQPEHIPMPDTHRSYRSRSRNVGNCAMLVFGVLFSLVVLGCMKGGDGEDDREEKGGSVQVDAPLSDSQWRSLTQQAIARGDFASAEKAVRSRLLSHPGDGAAIELLGDLLASQRKPLSASSAYQDAVALADSPSRQLLDKLAEQQVAGGRPFDAIDTLQRITGQYPDDPQVRFDLIGLATMIGASRSAIPHLQWLMQRGQSDPDSLIVLADPGQVQPDGDVCRQALQRSVANGAGDVRAELGLAMLDAIELRWPAVVQRLEPVVRQHPDFVAADLLLGRAIWEMGDEDRLAQWVKSIRPEAHQSPDYWLLAGQWAHQQGRYQESARAFWESIRLAPEGQLEAVIGLSQSLDQLGRGGDADYLGEQIALRASLKDSLKTHFERKESSQRVALNIANLMANLGRLWEAEAWARHAVGLPNERVADAAQRYLAIRGRLSVETPWQSPDSIISNRIDLSELPAPSWLVADSRGSANQIASPGIIRFQDQAVNRGLVHTCQVASAAQTQGHWIFHSLGGGVGVIDLDLDGWPDVALSMLDGNPMKTDSSPNRLFRNLNGHFFDVTEASGYTDRGFSHGIAIGDYNEDGFPDIFDGNYGQNRLYRNNGDGTFQDVTGESGIVAFGWSTSIAIVDIDGDAIPDLFETNYCGGQSPLERVCKDWRGMVGTCPPLYFDAQPDRVWRGNGDGTFSDATGIWMDQTSPGRGLGVTVGMFDENPGLDLYVANDMTANHLWSSKKTSHDYRLVELGLVRGLALNAKSVSQASMGIAVGDPNGDGLTDFFVTHFSNDHNTYYQQTSPGFWVDRSSVSGLAVPSIKMLGFGTQWHDFDNQGKPELIIANGHVDDIEDQDITYRMPPQLFRLQQDGSWVEAGRDALGEYFTKDHLGRAVAVADFNRDELTDIIITHLYEPIALLVNQSQQAGGQIAIELKATRGSRDAVGTIITMDVDGRKQTLQLTAGDGYLASNQRRIVVGMGGISSAKDVEVRWPSGTIQKIHSLDAGREYLLIEGDDSPFVLEAPR